MPDSRLGWKKDKWDPRDYSHKIGVEPVPNQVDLSQFKPAVRDQNPRPSCVGFGIGANITSQVLKIDPKAEWFSPQWIWNGARFIEGTLNQDVGVYPRDALDWLLKSGCLLEHFWPYNASKLDMSAPSSERMAQANKYPDFAYYRVVDGTAGICSAIASGQFVSIGSPWFDKWIQIVGQGNLPEVTETDEAVGGHETCLYGYDQTKRVFYGMNSWGTNWGDKGLFTMPFSVFDVFKKLGGYDAHYITFTTPPGPPQPSPCKWGNGVATAMNIIFMQKARGRQGRFFYGVPPQVVY